MGKHARHKLKAQEHKTKQLSIPIDENFRQEKIVPVVESLKAINADERAAALTAISEIISDKDARHMLLRERLIQVILSNILSDNSLEIVAQGVDVLRNVILAEGRDPAKFVVRENIRLPLSTLSKKILTSLEEEASLDDGQRQIINKMAESICGLVSAVVLLLGEMAGVIDVYRLASRIAAKLGDQDSIFTDCSIETAYEMLYYGSEDSPQLLLEFLDRQSILNLQINGMNADTSTWKTKIYGTGVIFNLSALTGEVFKGVNLPQLLISYLREIPKNEVQCVQTCLELLALLAQTDEIDLATFLFSEVCPIIHAELFSNPDLQLPCVNVLNNIGWSLNALGQDWESSAEKIYADTMRFCFAQLDDIELVSSALGLVNSTITRRPQLAHTMDLEHLARALFNKAEALFEESNDDWVILARALILVLCSENCAVRLNLVKETSSLIFKVLENSKDVETQVDALDSLFDLFGDNDAPHNDSEYVKKNLNERLEQLRPVLKQILKSPPKSDRYLRERALEALTNLNNFIVYKRT